MRILITGSTGFIGSRLIPLLTQDGHEVVRLVRKRGDYPEVQVLWDPAAGAIDAIGLEGLDAVIHLAGENIGSSPWTDEKKRKIYDSRVNGTRILCEALSKLENKPKHLLAASAIAYFGHKGSEIQVEGMPRGTGFLSDVCVDWETATSSAAAAGIRVANMRISLALTNEGEVWPLLKRVFKFGVGGKVGDGTQYVSWITLDDLLAAIVFVLYHEEISGPVNMAAPDSMSNIEFTKIIGRVFSRPTIMPAPKFALKAILGEMAEETILNSSRVIPRKLEEAGFQFNYPTLESALKGPLR